MADDPRPIHAIRGDRRVDIPLDEHRSVTVRRARTAGGERCWLLEGTNMGVTERITFSDDAMLAIMVGHSTLLLDQAGK